VIRYGRLCHAYRADEGAFEAWSTTKTLGAVVTGIAAYQTRSLARHGRTT
jgi:hypothetical protein